MGMSSESIRPEGPSSSAHALLGVLRPGAGPATAARVHALSAQEWDDTLALALQHNLAPLLQRALRSGDALKNVPAAMRAQLEEQRRATALDNLRNYGEFRRIANALAQLGITIMALKGLQLAELVYRDISLRPMSDLDILVHAAQVEPAIAALRNLDYELNTGQGGEYDLRLSHGRLGILVEVHWELAQANEPRVAPAEDLWRVAVPARLADADALVLPPEFLLLHVCTHLAYHHLFAFDLRALCDIAEIVRAYPALDWALVRELAERQSGVRGVAAALRLAREHLDAAVPADVLAALGAQTLDPDRLADALEQLGTFAATPQELQFAPNLRALGSHIGLRAKIALLWKRIFVSRAEIGRIYGIPEASARGYIYYAARLRDLVRRYASSARELKSSAALLAEIAERHARLAKWINDT